MSRWPYVPSSKIVAICGLISLSPKFANSVPVLGVATPQGKVTDQKMIDQHNKFRMNYKAMAQMIAYHNSFHLKPVIDKDLSIIPEYEEFMDRLAQELRTVQGVNDIYFDYMEDSEIKQYLKDNTWMMPAGDDRPALFEIRDRDSGEEHGSQLPFSSWCTPEQPIIFATSSACSRETGSFCLATLEPFVNFFFGNRDSVFTFCCDRGNRTSTTESSSILALC